MRKWLPLAILSVGGLGVLLLTEAGRRRARWMLERAQTGSDALLDFHQHARQELDRIQAALNRVADVLEPTS